MILRTSYMITWLLVKASTLSLHHVHPSLTKQSPHLDPEHSLPLTEWTAKKVKKKYIIRKLFFLNVPVHESITFKHNKVLQEDDMTCLK